MKFQTVTRGLRGPEVIEYDAPAEYQMKYIDGTPVDPEYARNISEWIRDADLALEYYGQEELENYARQMEEAGKENPE